MKEADRSRFDAGPDAGPDMRCEPTFGGSRALPQTGEVRVELPRARSGVQDRPLLYRDGISLAGDETCVDEVELVDTSGHKHLVLTNRRLIIRGNDHETIYPLHMISRLAVVKYIRWWMALLGIALSGGGALGIIMTTSSSGIWIPHLFIPCIAFSAASIVLVVLALLRRVVYVEIKCSGGDLKLRMTKDYEVLMAFLGSLGQRIG